MSWRSRGTGRTERPGRRRWCPPHWDNFRPSGDLLPRASGRRTGRRLGTWRRLPHVLHDVTDAYSRKSAGTSGPEHGGCLLEDEIPMTCAYHALDSLAPSACPTPRFPGGVYHGIQRHQVPSLGVLRLYVVDVSAGVQGHWRSRRPPAAAGSFPAGSLSDTIAIAFRARLSFGQQPWSGALVGFYSLISTSTWERST